MSDVIVKICGMIRKRIAAAERQINARGVSNMSKAKQKARQNEASEILGEIRKIIEVPE